MRKLILVGLGLTLVLYFGHYQFGFFTDTNYFTALSDIRNGKVEILTYGLALYDEHTVNEIASKYGFQYRTITGCVVTQKLINQVNSYNLAVEYYLDDLNGEGWLEKLTNEVNKLQIENK